MTNAWLAPITARDVMTKDVVTFTPETPSRRAAKLLLEKGISAAPVVDAAGTPIGMISENDLLMREIGGRVRWSRWLELLAEGEDQAQEFLNYLKTSDRPVREVMVTPVITVAEDTSVEATARTLQEHGIKRVPVLRDGRIVGIVSRADLVRALAKSQEPTRTAAER
ncbi:MAG TPA: CBS domain-containing protein [Alphaproteobacteria bacterium]|nr:CBS domain-containing protein [Alphaproteobacteria bacterium]